MTRDQIARAFLYATEMFDSPAEIKANSQHQYVVWAYIAADNILDALKAEEPKIASAPDESNGTENLKAIAADQPYQNSVLNVFEIMTILENKGGLMPDEAVVWFREWRTRPSVIRAAQPTVVTKCVAAHMGGEHCIGRCMMPKDCSETPITDTPN